jgi:AcrR family transcriptional regulator
MTPDDPRPTTDDRINAAALEIIREHGLQHVTMEAVSARSGVAKTTIYRRYADRFELLSGVLSSICAAPELGDLDCTEQGLSTVLGELRNTLEERFGLASVGCVIASDQDFVQEWRDKVVWPWVVAMRGYLAEGARTGALSADVDCDLVVEMAVGAMIVADSLRDPVPEHWADDLARVLWPMIAAEPSTDEAGKVL